MADPAQSLLSPAAVLLKPNKGRAEASNKSGLKQRKNGESTTINRKLPLLIDPGLCIFPSKNYENHFGIAYYNCDISYTNNTLN